MYKVVLRRWSAISKRMITRTICEGENEKEAQARCDELNKNVDPITEIYEAMPINQ